jgi:hypothetical protein
VTTPSAGISLFDSTAGCSEAFLSSIASLLGYTSARHIMRSIDQRKLCIVSRALSSCFVRRASDCLRASRAAFASPTCL